MADLIYDSFKEHLGDGSIDMDNDVFKVCLLTSGYTPATTHAGYADLSGEVADGNGYTTGGQVLTGVVWSRAGGTVTFDADDPQWNTASFTCRYAALYDDTSAGKLLVKCFDFGADKTVSNGAFTISFNATGILTLS